MKTHLFAFIALLFFLSEASAQMNNNIVIFCNDGQKFTLIMDGLKYNDVPASRVKATGLNLKRYEVKLIFENTKFKDLNTHINITGTGSEFMFGISKKNKKEYVMDANAVVLNIEPVIVNNNPSNTNTTNTNTGTYTNTNTTNTSTYTNTTTNTGTYTTPTTTTNTNNTNSMSVNVAGVNIGLNQNGGVKLGTKEGNVNLNTKDMSGNIKISDGSNDGITLNKVAKIGCATAISYLQFEPLKNSISIKTTDSTKSIAANPVIANNCFLTSHVKEILMLFSEDKPKMELAKKSYPHIHDLNNYHELKDVFTKEESKKEFHEFFHNQKQ